MNGLHIVNNQNVNRNGTGLPFVKNQDLTYTNFERSYYSEVGFYQTTPYKLPAFQIFAEKNLAASDPFRLYKYENGTKALIANLPTSYLARTCVDKDGNTDNAFHSTKDINTLFTLDTGIYQLELETLSGDIFYSELYKVGSVCCGKPNVSFNLISFTALDVTLEFVWDFVGQPVQSQLLTIPTVASIIASPHTQLVPNGNYTLEYSWVTDCGTYHERWLLEVGPAFIGNYQVTRLFL